MLNQIATESQHKIEISLNIYQSFIELKINNQLFYYVLFIC